MFDCNKKFLRSLFFILPLTLALPQLASAVDVPLTLFPLEKYNQNIDLLIKPSSPDYKIPLMSKDTQNLRLAEFKRHFFTSLSPWDEKHVNANLKVGGEEGIYRTIVNQLDWFSNFNKSEPNLGFGENFRPYDTNWISAIKGNINLQPLKEPLSFQAKNRAIAITNLDARILPTEDVHFYRFTLPGQGYPFDNLQASVVWAGTPVYIIAQTLDHAWDLVLTPSLIAWVPSKGIAHASNDFVQQWQTAAQQNLMAITKTQTSIIDEHGNFRFYAYIGSVFPAAPGKKANQILIPIADHQQNAAYGIATLSAEQATNMPLAATPQHFVMLMKNLIGRPYSWGGKGFYNDCSAEIKSLFTPFGLWLPRHSSQQPEVGKVIDLSKKSTRARIKYLEKNGHKFTTVIYLGGHIILYIGNYPDPAHHEKSIAMTYQNVWGINPQGNTRRAVIGKAVLLPLLKKFPEDPSLVSQAQEAQFRIGFLDQMPPTS